ncbi:MAG: hypothetical protein JJ913_12880 [Rhizobiaceae bacterium]|nr:hypothetical protein [Rhizobiaceae bacterium]
MLTPAANAISCDEDCHRRCRVCAFGVCVVEPSCHLNCEAAKKAACAAQTPLPIPLPPGPGDIADPAMLLCRDTYLPAYQAFTHSVIAFCANWEGRASDLDLIEWATEYLVELNLFDWAEFDGVNMRWCPLNGTGMVPAANRILLNPNLKSNPYEVAATLAHEMIHVRQFRRWPNDEFECRYGEQLVKGHGQGRANAIEDEAYAFEDEVRELIYNPRRPEN